MAVALIAGVNGQDGQYLKKILLENYDFNVYGLGRQAKEVSPCGDERFKYLECDLRDSSGFLKVLNKFKPDVIFYCAAIHGSLGYDYEGNWESLHCVNTVSMHAVLKYLCQNPVSHAAYFSSVKVFDKSFDEYSENTDRVDDCLYSFSKNSTERLINYYRRVNGVKANIFWLNNHESVWRESEYFSSLIIDNLHLSLKNSQHRFEVETLDFFSDWGHAKEYMEIVTSVTLSRDVGDYIISTGESVYARGLVEELFRWKGLDYRNHVGERFSENEKKQSAYASIKKLRKNHSISPKLLGLDLFKSIFSEKYSESEVE